MSYDWNKEQKYKGWRPFGMEFMYLPTDRKTNYRFDPLNYMFHRTELFGMGGLVLAAAFYNVGGFFEDCTYSIFSAQQYGYDSIDEILGKLNDHDCLPVPLIPFIDDAHNYRNNHYLLMYKKSQDVNYLKLTLPKLGYHTGKEILEYLEEQEDKKWGLYD